MKYKQLHENMVIMDKDKVLLPTILLFTTIGVYIYLSYGLFSQLIDTVIICAILFFMPSAIRRFNSDWVRPKDVIGNLIITKDGVYSENPFKEIFINEMAGLELRQNYIKGKRYLPRDIIHNGIAELKIKLKIGEDQRYIFLIENKEQFKYLGTTLKEYYRN